ncbi:MAG: TIGR04282 family arsenosugar biosynthesis glycosyltransferase [Elusimicrobia bacterium]|nr:TIGR04282 family arsenosugar biosynthesis glycosyltransferase [Elusimicrobiota bacterium]
MNLIVVFAKAPLPGLVKTRLCPPLTAEQAAAVYRALALDTLAQTRLVRGAAVAIAYDPGTRDADAGWLASDDIPVFAQEGPDLGSRLAHAFDHAFRKGAGRVLVIGTDCPHLPADCLEEAFAALERDDAVLGPTHDGGYCLIGLRGPNPAVFRNVPWSTAAVYGRTLELLREEGLSLKELAIRSDVDSWTDLRAFRKLCVAGDDAPWTRTREALRGLERLSWD